MKKWRDLFVYLVKTDLKLAYGNKTLGYLWTLLDPIVMTGIYLFLVIAVFDRGYSGFAAVLFLSLLVWKWFSTSVIGSVTSLTGKAKLLVSVRFPKIILPLTIVTTGFIRLLLGVVWIVPLFYIQGGMITLNLFWIPLLLLTIFPLTLGLALFCSIIGVYFRDLGNILNFVMRAWFYGSPILYSIEDAVPNEWKLAYLLNPFAPIFDSIMRVIRYGEGPSIWLLYSCSIGLIIYLTGLLYFNERSSNIAKDL